MLSKRIIIVFIVSMLLLVPFSGCVESERGVEATKITIFNPYKSVIYQIVTDRFFDGDSSNNNPFYNPNSYYMYHGGDFKGIIEKLDYLKELGVGAIWISPPFDNINKLAGNVAPYHGYWPRDFFVPEEHFGSWEDFVKLCEEAKKRGIYVIIDVVPNHTNPYSTGDYGSIYVNGTLLIQYLKEEGSYNPFEDSVQGIFHHNGNIGSDEWDIRWNTRYKNLFDLSDLNQMNDTVDSILKESLKLWISKGAMGIRIDAAKHVDPMWLRSYYAEALKVSPTFAYAEWFILSVRGSPLYWDAINLQSTGGIAILNLPLRYTIVKTFANNRPFTTLTAELMKELEDARYDFLFVNFLDNHDLPRYLNEGGNITTMHMAMTFVMTIPGVPIVYYGDEIYLHSTEGRGDPYNRLQMTFSRKNSQTTMFKVIKRLSELRRESDALAYGEYIPLFVSNNLYIFERRLPWESVIVAFSRASTQISIPTNLPEGTYDDYLNSLLGGSSLTIKDGKMTAKLKPYTVSIWYIQRENYNVPFLGAAMPMLAIPGVEMILYGYNLKNVSIEIKTGLGNYTPQILESNDTYLRIIIPSELDSIGQYIDIIVSSENGSSTLQVPFRHYKSRPIVVKIENIPKEYLNSRYYRFLVKLNLSEQSVPIYATITNLTKATVNRSVFVILDVRPAKSVKIMLWIKNSITDEYLFVGSAVISTEWKYYNVSFENFTGD